MKIFFSKKNKKIFMDVLDTEKNVLDNESIEDAISPLFLLGKCASVLDVLDTFYYLMN